MLTPQVISQEISELIRENSRGVTAVFDSERKLAEAEYALDLAEQRAFLASEGSVAERTARSRLAAADQRLARDMARAEFNRVKLKMKAVESALMAAATQAKLLGVESRM